MLHSKLIKGGNFTPWKKKQQQQQQAKKIEIHQLKFADMTLSTSFSNVFSGTFARLLLMAL